MRDRGDAEAVSVPGSHTAATKATHHQEGSPSEPDPEPPRQGGAGCPTSSLSSSEEASAVVGVAICRAVSWTATSPTNPTPPPANRHRLSDPPRRHGRLLRLRRDSGSARVAGSAGGGRRIGPRGVVCSANIWPGSSGAVRHADFAGSSTVSTRRVLRLTSTSTGSFRGVWTVFVSDAVGRAAESG